MLTVHGQAADRDCQGLSRRNFLQAGALGLGGLTLPWLLEQQARAAESGLDYVRDRAVVLVFLSGGASHIETFNPNMSAPAPYHSVTGELQTSLPGVRFGGTFPQLARHADKMAVIRSFTHGVGSHDQAICHVLSGGTDPTGQRQTGYSLGSMYARIRGANHPESGLPTYALLNSDEIDGQYRRERSRVIQGSRPGSLGAAYAPFNPAGKGTAIENMRLSLDLERLHDRRSLLTQLDGMRGELDASGRMEGVDKFTQQATDLLTGGAVEAFDLSREPSRIRDAYNTRQFRVGKKVFRPADIGDHFLTARRLIQHGCGFVTIHTAGWDMHADGNNPGIDAGMRMLGAPLDKALGAFLADLADRGLDEKVLTIITGDFGRTPKINSRGGRDHWARLGTLAFVGGGLNVGQVIGQSDRQNASPASEPVSTGHLLATVMHSLFDVGKLRLDASVPAELRRRIEQHGPIPGLVG